MTDDDDDDVGSEVPEEIYTEGAERLRNQEPLVLDTPPFAPLSRTATNRTQVTAYSVTLRCSEGLRFTFTGFCDKVRSSCSLGRAKIESIECYRQPSGPVMHRFLLLHLKRPGRSDIWLRIDRQLAPNLTLPKFFARYFQSASNDSVR